MIFKLIANTVSVDSSQPRDWQNQTASFVKPTELAFLVFELEAEYDCLEYLAGLYIEYTERGYIIAGTMERFQAASKLYSHSKYPHDIRRFYGYVDQKIKDFGY